MSKIVRGSCLCGWSPFRGQAAVHPSGSLPLRTLPQSFRHGGLHAGARETAAIPFVAGRRHDSRVRKRRGRSESVLC